MDLPKIKSSVLQKRSLKEMGTQTLCWGKISTMYITDMGLRICEGLMQLDIQSYNKTVIQMSKACGKKLTKEDIEIPSSHTKDTL